LLPFGVALASIASCSSGANEQTRGSVFSLEDDAGVGGTCHLGAECPPGGPCPDLTIDSARLQSSAYVDQREFADSDCALFEGCVGAAGRRILLRFDTATPNIGTGDLTLGPPSTDNACFQYSSCHNHYHFNGYAQYVLYAQDGTTVVATGHKQAFCLEDMNVVAGVPNVATPPSLFNCGNQGIHRGYQDVYSAGLDCQWIDVTGVPGGTYILSVKINNAHAVAELDYTNNEARVPVTIPGASIGGDDGGTDAAVMDNTDAGAPGDPCAAFGGCASCTAQAQCGWCNDGQIGCHTGTGSGPNGGVCAQTNWAWTSGQCMAPPPPPPVDAGSDANDTDAATAIDAGAVDTDASVVVVDACEAFTDCASCTAQPRCGFCGDGVGCRTGTGGGPNDGSCSATRWAWISTSCGAVTSTAVDAGGSVNTDASVVAVDACEAFTDCGSCTAQSACGFCGDGVGCRTGTGSGPNDGSCSATRWAWISNRCNAVTSTAADAGSIGATDAAPPSDPCAVQSDCHACTAQSVCGWCSNTGSCFTGTGTGPNSGACTTAQWGWLSTQCP
jgi:hypothetical protein